MVKLPLAWILDTVCGLRGFTKGNVALFSRQPIVLVQNGQATTEEVEMFAKEISDTVKEKTGIEIEWEVQQIK
jgi:UDP-N-acetylmuramate dehydrogenase